MSHLIYDATDDHIITFIDEWATLLEAEDYDRAFTFTAHVAGAKLTPALLHDLIKQHASNHATNFEDEYGVLDPKHRVTMQGTPTFKTQEKSVDRWPRNTRGTVGEIWYDLNFDGFATDYTATFEIQDSGQGLTIALIDISVH